MYSNTLHKLEKGSWNKIANDTGFGRAKFDHIYI